MFAQAGWSLETVVEAPLGDMDDPLLHAQRFIPRLLGARWRRQEPTARGGAR
jgi:hypothetical protein